MGWDQAPQSELFIPSGFGPSDVGFAILAPENIPAELIAFYPTATLAQAIIWQKDSQDYDWQVLAIPNVGEMFVAFGSRNASTGVVREAYRLQSPLADASGAIFARMLVAARIAFSGQMNDGNGLPLQGAQLTRIESTTNSGALAAETVYMITPTFTLPPNRVARLEFQILAQNSVANGDVAISIRKGNTTAGTQLFGGRLATPTAGRPETAHYVAYIQAGAVAATSPICLTAGPGGGGGNATVAPSGVSVSYLEVTNYAPNLAPFDTLWSLTPSF